MMRLFAVLMLLNVVLVGTVAGQGPEPERQEKRLSEWVEGLGDKDVQVRRTAAEALSYIGPGAKEAVPALIKALQDKDWLVRVFAVRGLSHMDAGADDVIPALAQLLWDENSSVRINAAIALSRKGARAEEAIPALIEALQDGDWRVREGAAGALGTIGPKASEAIPSLIRALQDADRYVVAAAAKALVKIGPESKQVISALTRAVQDGPDWPVRLAAADALRAIGPRAREAVPSLTKALQDGNPYVEAAAAMALRRMGPEAEEAVSALAKALQDKHASVRACAAWALGTMGSSEAKEALLALTKALQDEDKGVRVTAAEALGEMGPEAVETVPALIEAAKDGNRRVREAAAAALGRMDPKAKATIPGLVKVLHEGTEQVSGAEHQWSIASSEDWVQAKASASKVTIENGTVVLEGAGAAEGDWTSTWHDWQGVVDSAEIRVEAEMDLFHNKTIETVVKGSEMPYADADQIPHDWYGRCMIAIVDANRWIMALRSGVNHIVFGERDTIHLLTSSDEGRTWGGLDRWFDGSPIEGMPYEDGHTHSEPGLFRMPNGDLILQFWRSGNSSGTKQLRSTDHGKTWVTDIDRINVAGVTGAAGDMAIGTEDYFVDPENPSDVYMAFQYYGYGYTIVQHGVPLEKTSTGKAGTLLALSRDNGKSYSFLSWMGPLGAEDNPDSGATFEPAVEYVGNRTIVAVLRDATGNRRTWQTISTNMGASFRPLVEISDKINGAVSNGLWQRARLYKESNPYFQYNNQLNYARGEGRLWGFGIHSMGGGYTRKPVVYWSDDNGESWQGPELLHGPMYPGTDTGYGDLKRRVDGTFVAATYYCQPRDSSEADVEQYTFGGERAKVMIEADRDGDGAPDAQTGWRELYNGPNVFAVSGLKAGHWRLSLLLSSTGTSTSPKIHNVKIMPR